MILQKPSNHLGDQCLVLYCDQEQHGEEMKTVVVVLLVLVIASCTGGRKFRIALQSPCPDIFQYRQDDRGFLYGVLRIDCPDDTIVRLQVELSVGNNVEVIAAERFWFLVFFFLVGTCSPVVFFSSFGKLKRIVFQIWRQGRACDSQRRQNQIILWVCSIRSVCKKFL